MGSIKRITNEVLAVKLDIITEVVNELKLTLNGNGSLGLKTRVDRLEQTERSRLWSLRTLWASLISVILTVCANWVWG